MRRFLSTAALSLVLAAPASAQVVFGYSSDLPPIPQLLLNGSIQANAIDYGWFNLSSGNYGHNNAGNQANYVSGTEGSTTFRNFFVFSLPQIQITSAVLRLNSFTVSGNLIYTMYDFLGSISELTGFPPSSQTIFNDLGTGGTYGSRSFLTSETGISVDVTFDANGIAALNSKAGNQFAMGGRTNTDAPVEIPVTTAPEPASFMLFGCGLAGVAVAARRRRV